MRNFDPDKALKIIENLEMDCYRKPINLHVFNMVLNDNIMVALIGIDNYLKNATIRTYPASLFEDCVIESKETDTTDLLVKMEAVLKKLEKAERNEEGVYLNNVKRHLSEVFTLYRMVAFPPENFNPVSVRETVQVTLDNAEAYLDWLYR
jgi:hypothetical protein